MTKLFKPYLYVMVIAGVSLCFYYLFFQKYIIIYPALFFICSLVISEYYEFIGFDGSSGLSMGLPILFSLLLFFGPSVTTIGVISFSLVVGVKRVKIGQCKSLFSIKLLFNASQFIVLIFFSNIVINLLGLTSTSIILWKVLIGLVAMDLINTLWMTLLFSFMDGAWDLSNFTKENNLYYLYNTLLGISLVIFYNYIGIVGCLILYGMFVPFRQTIINYAKYKMREEELFLDELTKVHNKRFMENIMSNKIKKGENFSFIMMDVDKFKDINDTYGHIAGDKILIEFAKVLKTKTKEGTVIRYAGDEFCIISSEEEVKKTTSLILKELNNYSVHHEGNNIKITCSMGVFNYDNSIFENENENENEKQVMEKIIHNADKAMYQSKKNGGNSVSFFSEGYNK